MLVLLGPPFEGTDLDYSRLAQATGLVAYELRSKLKPGSWGVVRALADPAQAALLAQALAGLGYRVAVVDPGVGHEPERRVVGVRAIGLEAERLVLHLTERAIPVPWAALLTIVRGEVQLGGGPRAPRPSGSSSATFRAVVPSAAELAVFRESVGSGAGDAFAAADLHFFTVPWVARIDARSFDFSLLGGASEGPARDLDRVVEELARRSGARIDRGSRSSSLLSFTTVPARVATPAPGSLRPVRELGGSDDRFDAYSRMVAEAERQTRRPG